MPRIQISGKNLGDLASPRHCPRCFWVRNKLKLPYDLFPGIFSSIDSYSKKVTDSNFARFGRLPVWFDELGELGRPVRVPGAKTFRTLDEETGILLTGAADAIFKSPSGGYFIADYKTARYTRGQDEMLPIYVVQLNAYAYIAERTGLSPVKGLALLYYEPVTVLNEENVERHVRADGFTLRFTPVIHRVALEPEIIPPLLRKARAILGQDRPISGTAGCENCDKLQRLVDAVRQD